MTNFCIRRLLAASILYVAQTWYNETALEGEKKFKNCDEAKIWSGHYLDSQVIDILQEGTQSPYAVWLRPIHKKYEYILKIQDRILILKAVFHLI